MADCATVLSPIAELSRVALFVSNYRQTFVSNYKQAVVSWKKISFNVYDINQPSLHTPFSSVLLSISVFVAL